MRRPSGSPCLLASANCVRRRSSPRPRAQRLRIVAAVEVLIGDVVERHLFGPDQIPEPHSFGAQAGRRSDRVEHELESEAHPRPGDAAIGEDRAFVGRDRPGPAAIGRQIIGAGQDARDLRRFEASRERIGGIGAGIDDRLAVDAAQAPVALGVDGDFVMMLAAIGVGGQMLAAVLEPAHGDGGGEARASRGRFPRPAVSPCSRSRRRRRARRCGRGLLPGPGIPRGRCE